VEHPPIVVVVHHTSFMATTQRPREGFVDHSAAVARALDDLPSDAIASMLWLVDNRQSMLDALIRDNHEARVFKARFFTL
jgi:hypothetical protein